MPKWVKASKCSAVNCVEVAGLADGNVGVRNTHEPGRMLEFDRAEWAVFITAAKAGEFDSPAA